MNSVNFFVKKKLLYLGFHIGHSVYSNCFDSSINKQFFEGKRSSYYIINLNYTMFFLQKSMFFFKSLNKNFGNVLFFYSRFEHASSLNLTVRFFLKKKLFFHTGSSFIYMKWIPGLISNYTFCFARFIKLLVKRLSFSCSTKIRNTFTKTRLQNSLNGKTAFLTFFLKIFFLLEEQIDLDEFVDIQNELKKLAHVLRLVIFLRFWKSFFWVPDTLFSINPENNRSPIKEFSSLKIPVISTCDSNSDFTDVSYPIPMNDDTLISVLFLVSLFSNILKKEHLMRFV